MNLNDLKTKQPALYASWQEAQKALEDARAQVRPHNHESGRLWAEVEKAQAAYQAQRQETAKLEHRVRLADKAKAVAALARRIKGM